VLQTVQRMRTAGLQPVLHTTVRCTGCPDKWRGSLAPKDVGRFFAGYEAAVAHDAALAARAGAALYVVGSEMSSLESHTARWRAVVARARAAYKGRVAYVANWDAYQRVGFWDAVDVAGVAAYFPLYDLERPSVGVLRDAWHRAHARGYTGRNWLGELRAFARRVGKPVLFGEAGYRAGTTAAAFPYDASSRQRFDAKTQANAYSALLETFSPEPWWAGVVWWEWYPTPGTGLASYNPRGLEAERVLNAWYHRP
jgi:hypothetical protein